MSRTGASNALYNNEVTDFVDAMTLVIAQCDQERALFAQEWPDDTALHEFEGAAKHAKDLYLAALNAVRVVVALELRGLSKESDDDYSLIADALESGDYSSLAI